jgi:hypothetical protein
MQWLYRALYLFILFALPGLPANASEGTLSLYRWNPGYRAENQASANLNLSYSEYKKFFAQANNNTGFRSIENIYSGCYLTKYQYVNRSPASSSNKITKPAEFRKICLSNSP